jgi:hypothetical protein
MGDFFPFASGFGGPFWPEFARSARRWTLQGSEPNFCRQKNLRKTGRIGAPSACPIFSTAIRNGRKKSDRPSRLEGIGESAQSGNRQRLQRGLGSRSAQREHGVVPFTQLEHGIIPRRDLAGGRVSWSGAVGTINMSLHLGGTWFLQ